ncbi:hypothetical protein LOD99_15334 [Oopsacas minuta]|uniref:Uncharacterized protein n=1 Tax=Oopsacas minuta TaxID=111878 RepID=A0AAV7KEM4_9METZ|nr:hypothetical protein LOD99_15334 [Oopsacas minuta]
MIVYMPNSFRIVTKTDDRYLIQANTQDDLHRWLEAIQYNLMEAPSKVLQAMGEGEVKKTGYLMISISSKDYGKQWAVLKSTGLMQFFHKAEPKIIGFLQECTKLEMHNPTQDNASFYIEAVANKKVYHLTSPNKEDHYEWGDVIHETMKELRFPDKLVGYSQINHNQGAYIYIRRKLSKKEVKSKKPSLADTIHLPTVIHEVNDNYGDFQDSGMRAMHDQHIVANDTMRRLIQKNSHPQPPHPQVNSVKNSDSGESFHSQNSASSLNENFLPSSASSSSSGLSADSNNHNKCQGSYQSLPVHMHNVQVEIPEERGFTPPPPAESPPPPPFPNLDGFTFQDLIMVQQGDLPPPPDVDTLRNKDKRMSIYRNKNSSEDDGRDFTFSQEIRKKASRTSKNLESLTDYPGEGEAENSQNTLESQLLSALKKKKNKNSVCEASPTNTIEDDIVFSQQGGRSRLSSLPSEPKRKLAHFSQSELENDTEINNVKFTESEDINLSEEDKGQKRLSREVNSSVRAEKPFSEKKALIANLFKKEEVPLPLPKAPRTKTQVSSAMEERRKLLQGSMPDASEEIKPDSETSEKSQKIARMLEKQRQIQIMSAESRPIQRLDMTGRPRSQTELNTAQKKLPKSNYVQKESPKFIASPLASQTTAQQQQPPLPGQPLSPLSNVVLPPGWKSREENKATYYFNTLLGVSTWFYDDVVFLYEKSLTDPGPGWTAYTTDDNTRFFHHPATGKRTWNVDDTLPSDQ